MVASAFSNWTGSRLDAATLRTVGLRRAWLRKAARCIALLCRAARSNARQLSATQRTLFYNYIALRRFVSQHKASRRRARLRSATRRWAARGSAAPRVAPHGLALHLNATSLFYKLSAPGFATHRPASHYCSRLRGAQHRAARRGFALWRTAPQLNATNALLQTICAARGIAPHCGAVRRVAAPRSASQRRSFTSYLRCATPGVSPLGSAGLRNAP